MIVVGARGSEGGYNGVGRPARVHAFDATTAEDSDWRKDVTLARPSDMASGDWFLVDLRALRSADLEALTPEWRELIRGYDLAIVAPELSASSLLGMRIAP